MDAVEYVKQRDRMCNYYTNCNDCPAGYYEGCSSLNGISKLVPIVEQWVKEHPVKTRQSELLKLFPNTQKSSDGVIDICPNKIETEKYKNVALYKTCINSDTGKLCTECKRDFWLKEIE